MIKAGSPNTLTSSETSTPRFPLDISEVERVPFLAYRYKVVRPILNFLVASENEITAMFQKSPCLYHPVPVGLFHRIMMVAMRNRIGAFMWDFHHDGCSVSGIVQKWGRGTPKKKNWWVWLVSWKMIPIKNIFLWKSGSERSWWRCCGRNFVDGPTEPGLAYQGTDRRHDGLNDIHLMRSRR